MTESEAYVAGWNACMNSVDARAVRAAIQRRNAWLHGWLDALEADDDEEPCPEAAGYEG
jgi:hypothetical protein